MGASYRTGGAAGSSDDRIGWRTESNSNPRRLDGNPGQPSSADPDPSDRNLFPARDESLSALAARGLQESAMNPVGRHVVGLVEKPDPLPFLENHSHVIRGEEQLLGSANWIA